MNLERKYDILTNHNDYDVSISGKELDKVRNDPFNLGNTVKGLTHMNHKRNLSDYAEELVGHYAKFACEQYELLLSELSDHDQNNLVRLYIEATDREVNECVYGNDFSIESEFTCALLSMLQDDCAETRERFSEVTRQNTLIYYKESIQQVLDDACTNYHHLINNEQGLYAQQDRETGEIYWGRF